MLIKYQIFLRFLGLGIFVFLTQFYSINIEVINWDESDFILLGNSFFEGNLPYEQLWDLKPPLHFIYIGTMFKIFGPSLLIARIAGDLLIFFTSVSIFFISRKILSENESNIVALIYIFLTSYLFAQPTMTEYLSTLFVIVSMISFQTNTNKSLFVTGILVSLAVLTRTNTAFILVLYFFLIILKSFGRGKVFSFILGSSLPVIILSLVYESRNLFNIFLQSIFTIPLGNTLIRDNFLNVFRDSYEGIFLENIFAFQNFFVLGLFFFAYQIFKNKKYRDLVIKNFIEIDLYLYVFIFLCISIIVGGRFYYHYLIQLFPFIALFSVYAISKIFELKKIYLFAILFLISLNSFPLVIQSFQNLKNYDEIVLNYKVQNVASLIDEKGSVLALDNHLIYFYLDIEPITPVVHPNVIFKEAEYEILISSLVELNLIELNQSTKILNSFPDYIVCEEFCYTYIEEDYFDNYQLLVNLDGLRLFKYMY